MSAEQERRTSASSVLSIAVRVRLTALVAGLCGALGIAWSMRDTSASARAAGRLGLQRVQGNMENILDLLAMPLLSFCVILVVWSVVDLARLYRIANDPERFRGKRRRR